MEKIFYIFFYFRYTEYVDCSEVQMSNPEGKKKVYVGGWHLFAIPIYFRLSRKADIFIASYSLLKQRNSAINNLHKVDIYIFKKDTEA